MATSNRTILFTASCILLSLVLLGQGAGYNYVPIEFDNLEPRWSHVSFDSTIIDHTITGLPPNWYDGYAHIYGQVAVEKKFPIKDGYVYLSTNILYGYDIGGAIIEKIDLETGDLIWQKMYDLRVQEDREVIYRTIIEDDKLVLYNLAVDYDSLGGSILFGGQVGYLKKRYYDLETGNLILETLPDTNSFKIRTPRHGTRGMTILSENEIELITIKQNNTEGYFLEIDTLNHSGTKLTSTSYLSQELNLDWANTRLLASDKFVKDEDENLFFLNYYGPLSEPIIDSASIQLLKYSPSGIRTELPMEFSDFEDLVSIRIVNLVRDEIIMCALFENGKGISILFVDKYTGIINRQVKHELINTQFWEGLPIYDGEFFLMDWSETVDDKYSMDFYLSEGNNTVPISKFVMSHKGYVPVPYALQLLENGDYLVSFHYTERASPVSKGKFHSLIRITPEQLGIITSAKELNDGHNLLILYPNPTSESLTIEFGNDESYDLFITDMLGSHVMSKKECSRLEKMDLSRMNSGTYVVTIITEENVYSRLFQKI